MTQAIGLSHGIAHGHLAHGGLGYEPKHETKHETKHEVSHEIKANIDQAKLLPLNTVAINLAEHDKQTCLLIDALASAVGLLKSDFPLIGLNVAAASATALHTWVPQTRRFDYWPTGPPIV